MSKITSFTGENEFLRNDYETQGQIAFEGDMYNCVQRAFQASKTSDLDIRESIREADSIREVNSIGRNEIDLPDDWDDRRVKVMTELVRVKFQRGFQNNDDLSDQLIKTGDAELIMGDSRDNFWGIDRHGVGDNTMGLILMKVRDELKVLYPPLDSDETSGQTNDYG